MLVKEIMTRNIIKINYEKSVYEACQLYRKYRIGCLLVENEEERVIGILTERDIIERTICEDLNPKETIVEKVMSTDLKTIHVLDKLEEALKKMSEFGIKKLPVVKNNQIVGIVTITDVSKSKPELTKRFMDSWVKSSWRD
ncbi:MAG: CBS domain-containing protein [Candidatus Thermoplasmatota archaeon]